MFRSPRSLESVWSAQWALAQSCLLARRMTGSAPAAESVLLAGKRTLLLRLAARAWSPAVSLTPDQVSSAAGTNGNSPDRVGVVRDAFALYNKPERTLAQVLRPIGDGHVGVLTDLARPHSRMVVDEYERTASGSYELRAVANDLLRYLSRVGVTASLFPRLPPAGGADARLALPKTPKQSSNHVLMVAPTAFGFNEQTAQDNHFMHSAPKPGEGDEMTTTVLGEFAGLHHQLTHVHGVSVNLMQHSLEHNTPDAVFPNNWFSTHPAGEAAGGCPEGTMVLYPMKCPNRAAERRADIIDVIKRRGYPRVVDLTHYEKEGKYFEGTGVLVIDRVNGVAYVSISERADKGIAEAWAEALGYKELVTFRSSDARGKPVYHTNVMMAIGTGVAVVCGESIADATERQHVLAMLGKTHEVVDITQAQMDSLCGNAIEVLDSRGLPIMAMSTQAHNAFTPAQRAQILRHCADIVHAPIDTIERVGGGGVRCAIAELF